MESRYHVRLYLSGDSRVKVSHKVRDVLTAYARVNTKDYYIDLLSNRTRVIIKEDPTTCLLYTSDAADDIALV